MPSLFDPLILGGLTLPNRVIMAPLTRIRAGASRLANDLMAKYYVQRASAGLIITEATVVDPMGVGNAGVPGVWSAQQAEAWKQIPAAVHAAGGRIFMQLWHVGRMSAPMFLDGREPVSASAIAHKGHITAVRPHIPYPTPRPLETAEIAGVVAAYRRAAQHALEAGFDGVELHGANGYLLDQFLQDGSNHRTDDYGGSIENRARLMLEAADAAISVWGADRVGVHLAPRADVHSMGDSDLAATFTHVARELGRRKIAFLAAREYEGPDSLGPALKAAFGGVYIANERFTGETAQAALDAGRADAVAFGKAFIANPDLPERLRTGAPLNEPVLATFYSPGPEGYVDYPTWDELVRLKETASA